MSGSEENKLNKKLLVLEINEIPWRLIDRFKNHPKLSNIKKFFEGSKTYTTVITDVKRDLDEAKLVRGKSREGKDIVIDSGELSPWITWPTFHRGISSNEHQIKFLGQDISTFKGKAIWQDFIDRGYNIGVCGSLQSWPPLYPGNNGFYVPDTFAHDERCIPNYLEIFQRFNLDQVQKNGLVVRQKELLSKEFFQLIFLLPRLGITFSTLIQSFTQLLMELTNKNHLARRTTFQCILFWDIFKSLYSVQDPPAFSSFFTNHVASLMHRYWHDIFPEDFKDFKVIRKSEHLSAILFGLEILDNIFKDAMSFLEKNPDITLVFATSMGQDTIQYSSYEGFSAELENINKLFKIIGINPNDYKPLLAMVPQVAIEVKDPIIRKQINKALNSCFTSSGKRLFSVDEMGNSVSITIHNPTYDDATSEVFTYNLGNNKSKTIEWNLAGIKMHKLDVATAYHTPEGILAIYGKGINPDDSRKKIDLTECKSILLELAFSQ